MKFFKNSNSISIQYKNTIVSLFKNRLLIVVKRNYGPPRFAKQYEYFGLFGLRHKFLVWYNCRYDRKTSYL